MWRTSFVAAALLLAAAAPSKQASGAGQFALWQRYGRAAASALLPPRADRFFMTSRYGKRMESVEDGGAPAPIPVMMPDGRGPDSRGLVPDGPGPASEDPLCWYFGISGVYRCRTARDKYRKHNKKSKTAKTAMTLP